MSEPSDPLQPHFQRDCTADPALKREILSRLQAAPAPDALEETELEEILESLLRAWPVEPPNGFAAKTYERALAEKSVDGPASAGLLRVGGLLAACLALAFLLPEQTARPVQNSASAEAPAPRALIDEEIAVLLALADDLPQNSRWLIEEAPLLTLATARP